MTDQEASRYIGLHSNEAVEIIRQTAESAPFKGQVALTLFDLSTEEAAREYGRRFGEIQDGPMEAFMEKMTRGLPGVQAPEPVPGSIWTGIAARMAYEQRDTSQGVELGFATRGLQILFLHRTVLKMPADDARHIMRLPS